VQALGLRLGAGRIQVSTNVVDLDATPPHVMVARIVAEAAARGAEVGQGELVGLLPARCVAEASRAAAIEDPLDDRGVPRAVALDAAAQALRLERLDPDRVLEWHLAGRPAPEGA
jgi:hypothetical protein